VKGIVLRIGVALRRSLSNNPELYSRLAGSGLSSASLADGWIELIN